MIGDAFPWLSILIIGAGTFVFRLSFIQLVHRRAMPHRLQRLLRYVPAAVLAALVMPALVFAGTDPGLHAANPRLLAGALAAVVAFTTRNALWTLAAGMTALWLISWGQI